jgi:hypothetical protein
LEFLYLYIEVKFSMHLKPTATNFRQVLVPKSHWVF